MLTFVPDISLFYQERMLAFLRCMSSFLSKRGEQRIYEIMNLRIYVHVYHYDPMKDK